MKMVFVATSLFVALFCGCGSTSTAKKERIMLQAPPMLSDARPELARCGMLYVMHCQNCHDLPVASRYSAEKWQRIMPAMARKAKIDALTQDSIALFVSAARAEGR